MYEGACAVRGKWQRTGACGACGEQRLGAVEVMWGVYHLGVSGQSDGHRADAMNADGQQCLVAASATRYRYAWWARGYPLAVGGDHSEAADTSVSLPAFPRGLPMRAPVPSCADPRARTCSRFSARPGKSKRAMLVMRSDSCSATRSEGSEGTTGFAREGARK